MIFILGGEGFVGSAFVRECRRLKLPYTVITRKNYARYKGKSCGLFVNANGNSKKYLADRDPVLDFELSVTSTLKSLVDFNFRHYLFLSSVSVYADASTPKKSHEEMPLDPRSLSRYGLHKWLAEQLVRKYASEWIILRLGGMLGPNMRKGPVFDLLKGDRLRVSPRSRFQFIATDEVAQIAMKLVQRRKIRQVFNLCATGSIPLTSIAKQLQVKARVSAKVSREIWNMNNSKIRRLFRVSTTNQSVRAFAKSFK